MKQKLCTIKPYKHLIKVDYFYFLKKYISRAHTRREHCTSYCNSTPQGMHPQNIWKTNEYKRSRSQYAERGLKNELKIPEHQIRWIILGYQQIS